VAAAYQIATLLYCFDEQDRVLLMERVREPNRGLWSPCGGKLEITRGESPHAAAAREAGEEIGLAARPEDLHLTGIVSEAGHAGNTHWLMFLFELKIKLKELPPPHPEGRLAFFDRREIAALPVPRTDLEQIWPLFWRHRGGFFAAHCRTRPGGEAWSLEESIPV
jgi:ADP-ribose pyrophosphatase YjhB (NUDIX family)